MLAAPPPGHTWVFDGREYRLERLEGAPQQPSYAPQVTPGRGAFGNVLPFQPRPVRSNVMVREGMGGDGWARALDGVQDLAVPAPPGIEAYDAMAGRPSPESMAALAPLLSEYPEAGGQGSIRSGEALEIPRSIPRPADTFRDAGADK